MLNTRQKVSIAKVLGATIRFGRKLAGLPPVAATCRHGVHWSLDLREGIDLALFLGVYEPEVYRAWNTLVGPGDVVIDVGANIGAHTLPLARLVGDAGKVYAFEPTSFALAKLQGNMECNAELRPRIVWEQAMLAESGNRQLPAAMFSSWPLSGDKPVHQRQCGHLEDTRGARVTSLDDFARENDLQKVDLIKLDVDGGEVMVLEGARDVIRRFHPMLVLELAPYIFEENESEFESLLELLRSHGYRIERLDNGRPASLDPEELRASIPRYGGINVLASGKRLPA